jgi:predicted amidohydrolase
VQTRPFPGNIQRNIENHQQFIELALLNGAEMIIFPELSITGYEPSLAKELATTHDDRRFDDFQKIADTRQVTIGIGVPTKAPAGVCISMVLFQPQQARRTYSKKYLHADELPFFASGENLPGLTINQTHVALAICYELSIPEHSEKAYQNGAEVYIASVAKTVDGVERGAQSLSEIAKNYSMTVLMSNCIGRCDDFESAGKSAVWNQQGLLIGQLNDRDEGIIIFDTNTQERIERTLSPEGNVVEDVK